MTSAFTIEILNINCYVRLLNNYKDTHIVACFAPRLWKIPQILSHSLAVIKIDKKISSYLGHYYYLYFVYIKIK